MRNSLTDGVDSSIVAQTNPNASTSAIYDYADPSYRASILEEWQTTHDGPLASLSGNTGQLSTVWGFVAQIGHLQGPAYAFKTLNDSTLIELGAQDLIAQNRTDQAHLEYIFWITQYPNTSTASYTLDPQLSYVSIAIFLIAPSSRGSVTIQSAKASDEPVIVHNVSLRHRNVLIRLTSLFSFTTIQTMQI